MAENMVAPPAADGNANGTLTVQDFGKDGVINSDKELALVVQSSSSAKAFIANRQWTLLWRDADLLYQSPRPMSVYENTYILEPNVQRFTVAKVVNSVVPQLYKGLFYADPPLLMRPRPGTSQNVVNARTAVFSYLLDECNFKTETKWGLEQMAHLGTGIWKWGIEYRKEIKEKRTATFMQLTFGPEGAQEIKQVPTDDQPKIKLEEKIVARPF